MQWRDSRAPCSFCDAIAASRTVWLLDSFQGMPPTTTEDGEAAKAHIGKEVGDVARVRRALERVGADMRRVRIVPGWFEDTFLFRFRFSNCSA